MILFKFLHFLLLVNTVTSTSPEKNTEDEDEVLSRTLRDFHPELHGDLAKRPRFNHVSSSSHSGPDGVSNSINVNGVEFSSFQPPLGGEGEDFRGFQSVGAASFGALGDFGDGSFSLPVPVGDLDSKFHIPGYYLPPPPPPPPTPTPTPTPAPPTNPTPTTSMPMPGPNGFAMCICSQTSCTQEVLIGMPALLQRLKNHVVCGRTLNLCCWEDPWAGPIDQWINIMPCFPVEECKGSFGREYGTDPYDIGKFGAIGPCLGLGSVRCVRPPHHEPTEVIIPIVYDYPPQPPTTAPPTTPPPVYVPPAPLPHTQYELPVEPYNPPPPPIVTYNPPPPVETTYSPPPVEVVYSPPPVVVDTYVPPVETYAPPVETYVPPVETYAPPVETYAPPVETYAPPVETYAPPVETYAPPEETYAPPVETYAPPVETYQPPTYGVPAIGTGTGVATYPSRRYQGYYGRGFSRYGLPNYNYGGYGGYGYPYGGLGFRKRLRFSKGFYAG